MQADRSGGDALPDEDGEAGDLTRVAEARTLVQRARGVLVLTGAGISAESGVPTFRGPGGLWKSYRPEVLATPEAFARDPRLVWEWYGWRRELVTRCRPNAAHVAVASAALTREGITVVTQNVDGLHAVAASEVAGGRSTERACPVELHGSLFRLRCTECDTRRDDRGSIDASSRASLPRCDACGALMRPDIVWFGEPLDETLLSRTWQAAADAEVCLVIGTSAVVHPAAGIAVVTSQSGGTVIEVNPDATPLTPLATLSIRARATDAVPAILDANG